MIKGVLIWYFVHFLKTRFIDIKQRATTMAKPVVLVTGGGKRIGAEISKLLIDSGFFVLIHVNNSVSQAEQIIADNMQSGEKSGDVIRADLSDDLAVKSMIETVKEHKQVIQSGGLAGLVHNASLV